MAEKPAIVVSGIPQGVTKEQLTIHFQRQSNGGGEVNQVIFPLTLNQQKDDAMIIFDDYEVAKRAASTKQELSIPGTDNKVVVAVEIHTKIFENVRATMTKKVSSDLKDILQNQFLNFIKQLGKEGCVSTIENDTVAIEGTFFQVQNARRTITRALKELRVVERSVVVGAEREQRSRIIGNDFESTMVESGDNRMTGHDAEMETADTPDRNGSGEDVIQGQSQNGTTSKTAVGDERTTGILGVDTLQNSTKRSKEKLQRTKVSDQILKTTKNESSPNAADIETQKRSTDSQLAISSTSSIKVKATHYGERSAHGDEDVAHVVLPHFVEPFVMKEFVDKRLQVIINSLEKKYSSNISFQYKEKTCVISGNEHTAFLKDEVENIFSGLRQRTFHRVKVNCNQIKQIAEQFRKKRCKECWCSYSKIDKTVYVITTGDLPDTNYLEQRLLHSQVTDQSAKDIYASPTERGRDQPLEVNKDATLRANGELEETEEVDKTVLSSSSISKSTTADETIVGERKRSVTETERFVTHDDESKLRAVDVKFQQNLDVNITPPHRDDIVPAVSGDDQALVTETGSKKLTTGVVKNIFQQEITRGVGSAEKSLSALTGATRIDYDNASKVGTQTGSNPGNDDTKDDDGAHSLSYFSETTKLSVDEYKFWEEFYPRDFSKLHNIEKVHVDIQPADSLNEVVITATSTETFLATGTIQSIEQSKKFLKEKLRGATVDVPKDEVRLDDIEQIIQKINSGFRDCFCFSNIDSVIRVIGKSDTVDQAADKIKDLLCSFREVNRDKDNKPEQVNDTSTQYSSDVGETPANSQHGRPSNSLSTDAMQKDGKVYTGVNLDEVKMFHKRTFYYMDRFCTEYRELLTKFNIRVHMLRDMGDAVEIQVTVDADLTSRIKEIEDIYQRISKEWKSYELDLSESKIKYIRQEVEDFLKHKNLESVQVHLCSQDKIKISGLEDDAVKALLLLRQHFKLKKKSNRHGRRQQAASKVSTESDWKAHGEKFSLQTPEGLHVLIYSANITGIKVGAITNAANRFLQHGGGVARAISIAAGHRFDREGEDFIRKNGPMKDGQVMSQNSQGRLLPHIWHVINAVGPRWDDYEKKAQCMDVLKETFLNALQCADIMIEVKEVAIPLISSGIFGAPVRKCAEVLREAVFEFSRFSGAKVLSTVHLVNIDNVTTRTIIDVFQNSSLLPPEVSTKEDPFTFTCSEGLVVAIRTGDITTVKACAIVNPTDRYLCLQGGISEAIVSAAGTEFTNKCFDLARLCSPLRENEAIEQNSSGNLQKFTEFVIHAVVPTVFSDMSLSKRLENLEQIFLNVLSLANSKLKARAIAIPLLGTGVRFVSVPECAKTLKEVMVNFSRRTERRRTLNEIIIVNNDSHVTDVVAEVFRAYPKQTQSDKAWRNSEGKGSSSNTTFAVSREKREPYHPGNPFEDSNYHSSERQGRGSSTEIVGRGLESESQLPPSHIKVHGQHEGNNNEAVQAKALQTKERQDDFRPFKPIVDKPASSWSDVVKNSAPSSHAKDDCSICLNTLKDPKVLADCKHAFCTKCIVKWFEQKKTCPICKRVYGVLSGSQPWNGTIQIKHDRNLYLDGCGGTGAIILIYDFPDGIQGKEHPNPGKRYRGTHRKAYLPDTAEGNEVAGLLRRAFDARLVFTVGRSVTTGTDNCVIWNDIHHKTNVTGGPTVYGYPDPGYLARVKEELRAKGIM